MATAGIVRRSVSSDEDAKVSTVYRTNYSVSLLLGILVVLRFIFLPFQFFLVHCVFFFFFLDSVFC